MYVGGAGVTRGYINQPEVTSARFIPNPFSQQAGARLYRSGDLARYLPSGDIEYWGRIDHQVKIRGFRIELGEIKTRLLQHSEIREAVVVVREDQLENKRIVAYLIVADSAALLIPDLRTYLGKWLPSYMIPSAFVMLSSLPLTSNGKIDFEKLPVPESSRESSAQPFEQARTPVEEKLANILKRSSRTSGERY
jgi:acyl-coenzyme A synthetase/AMP-(fatty) acid ligase